MEITHVEEERANFSKKKKTLQIIQTHIEVGS
jgi:hypothetical protein